VERWYKFLLMNTSTLHLDRVSQKKIIKAEVLSLLVDR
jgi:hypothetical protein